ncbi:MAG: AAA family ATPase [Deltaproteobacteria bacterium]
MKKKATSKKPTPKAHNAALARIWQAAHGLASCAEDETLDQATKTALAPFLESALELASASFTAPREDMTPLIQRAQVAFEAAIQVMPTIKDYLDSVPPTAKAAKTLQVGLVREAVKITRAFSSTAIKPIGTPTSPDDYEPYAVTPAAQLEEPDPSRLWLIEHLWQRSGTGILGGSAKGAKTWLCLDLALSVASGTPALDNFAVHRPGGVLFVSAEGGQAYLRERLNAMCAHRGLNLDSLPHPLDIIPTAIRIDTPDGLGRLRATIKASRPVLLVLDPLVRMHRIDENSASCVSALLSNLTELQQAYDLAILVAHHSTKHGSRKGQMSGQDFRGSSDLYAWGDSNVFLGKKDKKFVLAAEHRAAPATEKWTMVATADEHPRLEIVEGDSEDAPGQSREEDDQRIDTDITELIRREGAKSKTELRTRIKGSNARIGMRVDHLAALGTITQVKGLWGLATTNGKARHPGPS